MGISLFLLWPKNRNERATNGLALAVFGTQLTLNVLWTFLFFGSQLFFVGFVEILILWGAIALTIGTSYRISKTAGLILVPYIAWVTIAMFLNYYVWILNA